MFQQQQLNFHWQAILHGHHQPQITILGCFNSNNLTSTGRQSFMATTNPNLYIIHTWLDQNVSTRDSSVVINPNPRVVLLHVPDFDIDLLGKGKVVLFPPWKISWLVVPMHHSQVPQQTAPVHKG